VFLWELFSKRYYIDYADKTRWKKYIWQFYLITIINLNIINYIDMLKNFVPPDLSSKPSEFITQDWLSRSVWIVREAIQGDMTRIVDNPAFKFSHIHWLSRELHYMLLWGWHSSREEIQELEMLQSWLLEKKTTTIEPLMNFFREKIIKMGELAYSNMVRYEQWEKQWEAWDNALYQWNILQDTILFGIRIGLDSEILNRWKSKLSETQLQELKDYTMPEAYIPPRIGSYFSVL